MARPPAKSRKDGKPNQFTFQNTTNADRNKDYSPPVGWQLQGINIPITVTVTGGSMSKNGGLFTTDSQTGQYDDVFLPRRRSSANYATGETVTITAGGVSSPYTVTTGASPSPTPTPFSFTPITGATINSPQTSSQIQVQGIAAGVELAGSVSGASYSQNGGPLSTAPFVTVLNDTFILYRNSSPNYSTTVLPSLTIATVTGIWSITTEAQPPLPPPPPSGRTWGVKTRSGFGAVFKGIPNPVTGVDSTDFTMNASNNLVPSGTYGAFKTYLKSPGQTYSLTFSDATTEDFDLVASAAHVTATSADTATSNQLLSMLSLVSSASGALVLGDTVLGRPGTFNPTSALWRYSRPSTGWAAGSGSVITIQSETPDASLDVYGNPNRGGDFIIGNLIANTSTDVQFPITFADITYYSDLATTRPSFGGYSSTVGYGQSYTRCHFENGPDVPQANLNTGLIARGGTVHQCYFTRFLTCMTGGKFGQPTAVTSSVFHDMVSDGLTLSGNMLTIEDNLFFNWPFLSGAHPDAIQHSAAGLTADITSFGTVKRNLIARNVSTVDSLGRPRDSQGIFLADAQSPYYIDGATVENNGVILTAQNGIAMARYRNAPIRFNTVITALNPLGTGVESTFNMLIFLNGCVGCSVTHNVAIGYSGLTGNTENHNVTLPKTMAAYLLAFPNYVGGQNPNYDNREAILTALTPANRTIAAGGLVWPDLQVSGMLFPATTGETIGAWNDGSAYDPTNPVWVAAHPPAA